MITGKTLLDNGWTPGPHFGQALQAAKKLEGENITLENILKEIEQYKPKPTQTTPLRTQPLELAEAIHPENPEEEENLQAVRKCMGTLLDIPVVTQAAIMPDACPAGPGITVGGAIAVDNAIMPAAHSADICCSMYLTFYKASQNFKPSEALNTIEDTTNFGPYKRTDKPYKTPSGYDRKNKILDHEVLHEEIFQNNPFLKNFKELAKQCLGTNGDGNHFAYLGTVTFTQETLETLDSYGYNLNLPANEKLYAYVTHHGSRNLGAKVYKEGQTTALKFRDQICPEAPNHAAWIPYNTPEGQAYWEALQYIERWTKANHEVLHREFRENVQNLEPVGTPLFNAHNFVWKRGNLFYHGKGATPAWNNENGQPQIGIIPLNMAAPILITTGNNNEKFLSFSPHGAGRNISRNATLKKYTADDAQQLTKDIDIRWASGTPDISETPLGYKNAEQVINQIQKMNLATIHTTIQPIGCVMAGHIETHWKKTKSITHNL